MVDKNLDEEKLLEEAEKIPSNVTGSTISVEEKGVEREAGYTTTTPAELGKNKDRDEQEQDI